MHPFPVGTKVETNENYFKQFGRRVIGTSVAISYTLPNEVTMVKCEYQEGNIIPDYEGNIVLMMSKDLQKHTLN